MMKCIAGLLHCKLHTACISWQDYVKMHGDLYEDMARRGQVNARGVGQAADSLVDMIWFHYLSCINNL